MYSSNAYRKTIDQEQLQLSTTENAHAFGGSINNPMAVNIHGQPLWHGSFSNIRRDSHSMMDIDSWSCEMKTQSHLTKSYGSGGQPPSLGDVRQMVVSEPSGSNHMYSDGQPPSVNDVCRREASQSEASCNRYEGTDEHEVQQVYKRGTMGRSTETSAYSGYDERTQDLVSSFGSKISQSYGVPHMTFNSINSTINESGLLKGAPPQPFQRIGTSIKVYMTGAVTIPIDVSTYSGYDELKKDIARRFGVEGQLEDRYGNGLRLVYVDCDEDVLILGDDPWQEFVDCVSCIKICSPQEVHQMSLDVNLGGNSILPNQACTSSGASNSVVAVKAF